MSAPYSCSSRRHDGGHRLASAGRPAVAPRPTPTMPSPVTTRHEAGHAVADKAQEQGLQVVYVSRAHEVEVEYGNGYATGAGPWPCAEGDGKGLPCKPARRKHRRASEWQPPPHGETRSEVISVSIGAMATTGSARGWPAATRRNRASPREQPAVSSGQTPAMRSRHRCDHRVFLARGLRARCRNALPVEWRPGTHGSRRPTALRSAQVPSVLALSAITTCHRNGKCGEERHSRVTLASSTRLLVDGRGPAPRPGVVDGHERVMAGGTAVAGS